MKEIKTYVRMGRLTTIVSHLERKGARDLTVTRVEAIGALADAEDDRLRLFRKEASYTGERGDGKILIFNVERTVNTRTGEEGDKAL